MKSQNLYVKSAKVQKCKTCGRMVMEVVRFAKNVYRCNKVAKMI